MKTAVIIYNKEDVGKNRRFIEICSECFAENGIGTTVMIDGESDFSEIGEECFVINRSRNPVLARQLENRGIKVFNSSSVTKVCNDKWKTYLWARERNIPVLETVSKGTEEEKISFKFPRVIKSCGGHGGSEVFLVNNIEEMDAAAKKVKGNYIIQKFACTNGRDIRVYVIGGEIILAICRQAQNGFKSNFSLGGKAFEYQLNDEERNMAEMAAAQLGADYAGIDFMYDGDRLVLNEIEDAAGARMVYEHTDTDIVRMFAKYVSRFVKV